MSGKKILNTAETANLEFLADTIKFRPIWDIHCNLKCPLVGTCLTVSEQRRILKKSGISVKRKTPYQIHQAIMIHLNKENGISAKTDRIIRHKYRDSISELRTLNEEQLKEAWQKRLHSGEFEGIFYVVASRFDISEEFLLAVYGEIHMMSHANVKDIMKSKRSLYV